MSEFFKALEQADRDRAMARPAETAPRVAGAEPPPSALDLEPPPPPPPVERLPELPSFKAPAARAERRPEPSGAPDDRAARDGIDGHMVSLVAPNTFEAEQYRTLRHMIEELHDTAHVSIIACTSPASGDGKTISAINLAGALAQAPGRRVLLVDADLRRPCIARELTLGADAGPGLVGAIVHRDLTLAQVVRRRPPFTLSVVPAGSTVSNPYELLKSARFAELMEEARRDYDYVVLDTPPAVAIPDCRAIAPAIDGFILIVAAHRTPRKLVEEALNAMEPRKVLGIVFNRDDRPLSGYYHGYGQGRPANGTSPRRWTRSAAKAGGSLSRGLGLLKRGRR